MPSKITLTLHTFASFILVALSIAVFVSEKTITVGRLGVTVVELTSFGRWGVSASFLMAAAFVIVVALKGKYVKPVCHTLFFSALALNIAGVFNSV